jgi:hypothetical protein
MAPFQTTLTIPLENRDHSQAIPFRFGEIWNPEPETTRIHDFAVEPWLRSRVPQATQSAILAFILSTRELVSSLIWQSKLSDLKPINIIGCNYKK